MIDHGEFLEWAEVFGNFYGTALSALDHARIVGKDLLLDIDVQGAVQVMQRMPEAVSIFILPPSPQELELRLRNRSQAEGMTQEAVIERRLSQARQEIGRVDEYRYALVNDRLDQAASEMRAIVLRERGEADAETAKLAEACSTAVRSTKLRGALANFGMASDGVGAYAVSAIGG